MAQLLFSYPLLPSSEFLNSLATGEGLRWKLNPSVLLFKKELHVYVYVKARHGFPLFWSFFFFCSFFFFIINGKWTINYTHFKEILLIVIFQPVLPCLSWRKFLYWYFPLKFDICYIFKTCFFCTIVQNLIEFT